MTILETLACTAQERVALAKQQIPLEEMRECALERKLAFPFKTALQAEGLSMICEVKRASPSKGLIAENFPYLEIAQEYVQAGATAISVLTEPSRFLGQDTYLKEIAAAVSLPVLRKDFIVDPYQMYEARVLGASAVLLICAILKRPELEHFLQIAWSLGMDALVEVHNEQEVADAVAVGANIIGVNHRNLHTFTVDLQKSEQLRPLIPKQCVLVAESGIRTAQDTARLRKYGVDAVLVGETLMRAQDKKAMIAALRGDTTICTPK